MNNSTINQATSSCIDDYDPHSISVVEASRLILQHTPVIAETETVQLKEALERVLAQDVKSEIDVPGYDNSAMDGYALQSSDLPLKDSVALQQIGAAFAGHPFEGTVNNGECIRIMTGAPLPKNCDTVVIQEKVAIEDHTIRIDANNKAGQNVRLAGEDIPSGHTLLTQGTLLRPADLGLLASCGITQIIVKRLPKVAFFSTGDELIPSGDPLQPGQIYDSNRYTLFGMLKQSGVQIIDLGIVKDTREMISNAFHTAAAQADMIITSGGVSVGEADFVKSLLSEIGQVHFWKVAIKPGRPLAFGRIKEAIYFGLPGNPVSVMITYYILVQAAIKKMMGTMPLPPLTIQARCMDELRKRKGRIEYQRGILRQDEHGAYHVSKTGSQGSGILSSMSTANCLIVLPMDAVSTSLGTMVETIPFQSLI